MAKAISVGSSVVAKPSQKEIEVVSARREQIEAEIAAKRERVWRTVLYAVIFIIICVAAYFIGKWLVKILNQEIPIVGKIVDEGGNTIRPSEISSPVLVGYETERGLATSNVSVTWGVKSVPVATPSFTSQSQYAARVTAAKTAGAIPAATTSSGVLTGIESSSTLVTTPMVSTAAMRNSINAAASFQSMVSTISTIATIVSFAVMLL